MRRLRRATCAPSDHGASAVEAGLVVSVVLVPLLVGVLQWGDYFWRAQEASSLAPSLPTGAVAGTFSCAALRTAVTAAVVDTVNDLDPDLGPIGAGDVTVSVVERLPIVGVIVRIRVTTAEPSGIPELFPMPHDGAIVVEFLQRLDDVQMTEASCS